MDFLTEYTDYNTSGCNSQEVQSSTVDAAAPIDPWRQANDHYSNTQGPGSLAAEEASATANPLIGQYVFDSLNTYIYQNGRSQEQTGSSTPAADNIAGPSASPQKRGRGRPRKAPGEKQPPTFYRCRFCGGGKRYKSSEGLCHHMAEEHQLFPAHKEILVCSDSGCGKRFGRRADLNKHCRRIGFHTTFAKVRNHPRFQHPMPTTREDKADTFALAADGPVANALIVGREHISGRGNPRAPLTGVGSAVQPIVIVDDGKAADNASGSDSGVGSSIPTPDGNVPEGCADWDPDLYFDTEAFLQDAL